VISRLPRWIEYGAFVLAFVAGCINAIGLLGFQHQSVSHLSGTATLLGTSLVDGSPVETIHFAGLLLAFFFGASISGYLLHGSTLKLGRHYDTALIAESLLIFAAFYLLSKGLFFGHYAASAACGIQNGLATTYSGAIVRTTHVTGIFTDLGLMLGSALRGDTFDRRKAVLFLLIIGGFIAGGIVGAFIFEQFHFSALLAPGLICLLLAACYHWYSRKMLPR
jgi:uncharacterized membrane protein YoaK (UPF0700 family)